MKTPSPQEAAKTVRELPILFAPDLAQKVYLGLKTETRRLVKPRPVLRDGDWFWKDQFGNVTIRFRDDRQGSFCLPNYAPYQPGDLLYVRETFVASQNPKFWPITTKYHDVKIYVAYRAEQDGMTADRISWCPSIHMPKWATRTWLEVLSVSVERVQDIGVEGLVGEGYHDLDLLDLTESCLSDRGPRALQSFSTSWNARYPGLWDRNDWVFVYKFKKVEAPNGRA